MAIPPISPDFNTHPFIQSIAGKQRWTVSDNTKRPLDMFMLIYRNKVVGAAYHDEASLESLPVVQQYIPNAPNYTFYMDALTDGFVMLDVEKTCPQDIKDQLLKLPYIYGEVSASGKGYHLIFPIPDCFSEYPIAQKKIVMKEEHGYYEILLNHYAMFTRRMIAPADPDTTESFDNLFRSMCKKQKEVVKGDADVNLTEPEPGPDYDKIVGLLNRQTYRKTPDDFSGDISRFEYGFISTRYQLLKKLLAVNSIAPGYTYSDNEKAWILYNLAKDNLPHRAKHDEVRNNLPWLLYLAQDVIAKDIPKDKKR